VEARGKALGYFDHLKAVHLNDSKYRSGMGKDRHETVGRGEIGEKHIARLLQSESIRHLPIVLETPGEEGLGHAGEIQLVRKLMAPAWL
jgi:deoxyribonuclease-4